MFFPSSTEKNSPRLFRALAIVCLCMAYAAPSLSAPEASVASLEPVTVQLKWKHQFQFAGFYAAVEKGFYRDAGFDVTLKPANYDTDPIEEVLSGRADYGVANSELALYRLQGKPVTALAVIIQHSPIVLMTLKESNIFSPQDLIGKRVMYPGGHYGANTLGILRREGVLPSQIESIPLSFNIDDLIDKKVDAMVGYITDQPHQLEERGIDYQLIVPRAYGIDFYGDTLFTSEAQVEKDSSAVEKFRAATVAGWRYAVKHPEEIIDLLISTYQSEKNRAELRYEAQETIKLIVPDLVEIGHMNPGRWQHIIDTFIDLDMVNLASGTVKKQQKITGFLYEPSAETAKRTISQLVRVVIIVLGVIFVGLVALILFNRHLQQLVKLKTRDLREQNTALEESSRQLKEKESALSELNIELEMRILDRTRSLDEANQHLREEIEFRKEKERSLELLHQAVENSSSAVVIVDEAMMIRYASAAMSDLTGASDKDLNGHSITELDKYIKLPDMALTQLSEISEQQVFREIECITPNGTKRWLQVTVTPLTLDSDRVSHYVIVSENISELKVNKDKLEKMALYDSLTGLDNRVLFNIRLEKAIHRASRSGVKTALLFIDIDHFKVINDTAGHEGGDKVLKTISERLKRHVRENDPIARISGDEFTVLLTDIHNYSDASRVTTNLLEAFQQPVRIGSQEIFVTASIGVSITPDDSLDMDQLMRNADLAMYQAKQNGRNNFQFFSKDMNKEVKRKNVIEKELKQALQNNEFFLLYQPKVSFATGKLVGVEALIRWRFSENEIRPPVEFIPVAEETGLIIPIGYWVIQEAQKGLHYLKRMGFDDVNMSVNIAPRQLKELGFLDNVKKLFEPCPKFISDFELEITESSFVDDNNENINRLKQLRKAGFHLSIDDFGTGYSSLSYLQRLPIDTIKIDRSFVTDFSKDSSNAEIVKALTAMSHNLNLTVVVEGVETSEQIAFLKESQCDIAQGYYFGKPMMLDVLVTKFDHSKSHI